MSRQQQVIRTACLWSLCVFAYRTQVGFDQMGCVLDTESSDADLSPHYVAQHLLIRRQGDHLDVGHMSFPSTIVTLFKPIFQKAFLHKVLDLHNDIKHMRVWSGSRYVTLMDMCYRQTNVSKKCVTPSLLEYYQAVQKTSTNRRWMIITSLSRLTILTTSLAVQGDQFHRSTHLILTYIFRDPKLSKTSRKWKKGLMVMVNSAISQGMDIHVYESGSGYARGPLKL